MASVLVDAVDILINQSGRVSYLQADKLYEYYAADATVVGGSITFNNSDLGYPDIDKLINFVDVDYEGAFNLSFFTDGTLQWTIEFTDKATRSTVWRNYPLSKRIAFQKLKLYITSATADTKIYGLEVDFSILKRRRYN